MKADCRLCKYFIQDPKLIKDPVEREKYLKVIDRENVLGWCLIRKKPVTYYVGKCRYFKRLDKQLSLHDFYKINIKWGSS